MNEKQLKRVLDHVAEGLVPADVDLWPAIRVRFGTNKQLTPKGNPSMSKNLVHNRRTRLVSITMLALLVVAALFFATPQGRAWAQEALRFFTRAGSDTLPAQSWQMTSTPAPEKPTSIPAVSASGPATPAPEPATPTSSPQTPTTDPGSILDANLTVQEVEGLAGFPVKEPGWLPGSLTFTGASFDPDHPIARIFYQDQETNGLVLREEPFQSKDNCELCGLVGASADVQAVQIGAVTGEYVEGVWKLTDKGPVWESDPYLKTLRWQVDGMAFELVFMGPPDAVTKDDLVAIAASIK